MCLGHAPIHHLVPSSHTSLWSHEQETNIHILNYIFFNSKLQYFPCFCCNDEDQILRCVGRTEMKFDMAIVCLYFACQESLVFGFLCGTIRLEQSMRDFQVSSSSVDPPKGNALCFAAPLLLAWCLYLGDADES